MEKSSKHEIKLLKTAISKHLAEELDVKLSSFQIESSNLYSDDLIIVLKVSLTPKKLPKDFMLRLVSSATKAIRDTGESRYTIIKPRLSRGQRVAA